MKERSPLNSDLEEALRAFAAESPEYLLRAATMRQRLHALLKTEVTPGTIIDATRDDKSGGVRSAALKEHFAQRHRGREQGTDSVAIVREHDLAEAIATLLPELERLLPRGDFGPLDLEEHFPVLYEKTAQFVYDWGSDTFQWKMLLSLFPPKLAFRFCPDAKEKAYPDKITSVEMAIAVIERIAKEAGLMTEELLSPQHFARALQEFPALKRAVMFLADQQEKEKEDSGSK